MNFTFGGYNVVVVMPARLEDCSARIHSDACTREINRWRERITIKDTFLATIEIYLSKSQHCHPTASQRVALQYQYKRKLRASAFQQLHNSTQLHCSVNVCSNRILFHRGTMLFVTNRITSITKHFLVNAHLGKMMSIHTERYTSCNIKL